MAGKPEPRRSASKQNTKTTKQKAAAVDPVADALSHQPARQAALEAALRAVPGLKASVESGQRWEVARQAVDDAVEPYNAALLGLDPDDPKRAEKSEALRARIGDVREQTLAAHGFPPATAPKSPSELLRRLQADPPSAMWDFHEYTSRPRPTDSDWAEAERIRKQDPSLPELPSKPEAGRERYVVLVRWCGDCIAIAADQTLGAKPKALPAGDDQSADPAVPVSPDLSDPDYRPAAWFTGKIAARLRMASRKDRKTKRVRTRTIGGVVCYCAADVRQWWPEAIPEHPK